MATMTVRLADPLPAGFDIKNAKVVISGSKRNDPGNSLYQDKTKTNTVTTVLGELPNDLLCNGIVISRVPYTFESDLVIIKAPYSVKEQLARFVEKLMIVVQQGALVLTATQIRAL